MIGRSDETASGGATGRLLETDDSEMEIWLS